MNTRDLDYVVSPEVKVAKFDLDCGASNLEMF
jgi:hypothetical protein